MKLFYRVLLFIFPAFMAILVNASIFDSSCSKQLLPWTVFSIEDERMTLDRCFEVVVNKSATNIQANYSKKEVQEVDYVCTALCVCILYSMCVYCTEYCCIYIDMRLWLCNILIVVYFDDVISCNGVMEYPSRPHGLEATDRTGNNHAIL